jgi:uncharacterized protein (UPF0335 family)
MTDTTYTVTAEELRAFVERIESINGDIAEYTETRKEIYAEARGRGYCTKTLSRVVADRKKRADELAEQEAVLELYKQALGMA